MAIYMKDVVEEKSIVKLRRLLATDPNTRNLVVEFMVYSYKVDGDGFIIDAINAILDFDSALAKVFNMDFSLFNVVIIYISKNSADVRSIATLGRLVASGATPYPSSVEWLIKNGYFEHVVYMVKNGLEHGKKYLRNPQVKAYLKIRAFDEALTSNDTYHVLRKTPLPEPIVRSIVERNLSARATRIYRNFTNITEKQSKHKV